jgi:hypothetical protein
MRRVITVEDWAAITSKHPSRLVKVAGAWRPPPQRGPLIAFRTTALALAAAVAAAGLTRDSRRTYDPVRVLHVRGLYQTGTGIDFNDDR